MCLRLMGLRGKREGRVNASVYCQNPFGSVERVIGSAHETEIARG